jgi:hypothetical protein
VNSQGRPAPLPVGSDIHVAPSAHPPVEGKTRRWIPTCEHGTHRRRLHMIGPRRPPVNLPAPPPFCRADQDMAQAQSDCLTGMWRVHAAQAMPSTRRGAPDAAQQLRSGGAIVGLPREALTARRVRSTGQLPRAVRTEMWGPRTGTCRRNTVRRFRTRFEIRKFPPQWHPAADHAFTPPGFRDSGPRRPGLDQFSDQVRRRREFRQDRGRSTSARRDPTPRESMSLGSSPWSAGRMPLTFFRALC